jgi:signal transduction histidine kinase
MDALGRVTSAGRAFALAAILGASLVSGVPSVIISVIVVALVAMASIYISLLSPSTAFVALVGETLLAALVIAMALPEALVLLPYLVVLAFLAGLSEGLRGAVAAMTADVAGIAFVAWTMRHPELSWAFLGSVTPWFLMSLGASAMGSWVRNAGIGPPTVAVDASYEAARRLLGQLRVVTRRLSAGLDSSQMAAQLLELVHDRVGDSASAMFVRTDSAVLSPLGYRGIGAQEVLRPSGGVIDECWRRMEPTQGLVSSHDAQQQRVTVLPLRVGLRMIGVLVSASPTAPPTALVQALMAEVDGHSLRLDTAMVFDEVRALATADERRRMAREIHDGIAQEVASLGYQVDELLADVDNPQQRAGLQHLRDEVGRVVNELRLSIFDLRTEVSAQSGLGAALSDYVRRVGSGSTMVVHLSLDEAPTRLPPLMETELLRIAQEAITNARKHSNARNLWVECTVDAPFASLEISDDGSGFARDDGAGREDSFGLRMMKERAARVDGS